MSLATISSEDLPTTLTSFHPFIGVFLAFAVTASYVRDLQTKMPLAALAAEIDLPTKIKIALISLASSARRILQGLQMQMIYSRTI